MKVRSIWILSCLMLSAARPLLPQEAVGLPFLKIGTGARQAGMGGVFTGVSDDVHALYWNPGGLGHIRKWQWAASYTRWFTDIYQANLSMVHQVRGMGSRKVSWGLFASYLGMPEWDATGGKETAVSAGHLLAGLSFGERLDWLHPSVAAGFSVKAIQSRLADYSATGFAGDAGILFKPSRFRLGGWGLGLFEYGLFSAGASLLHVGADMKFDDSNTALPRTWQSGAALRVGRFDGWSLLVAGDVWGVKNREAQAGAGGELWWKEILGCRAGYRFNGKDLGDWTFGIGFRWDDVINSMLSLPSRYGDAFEISMADVGYGEVLQQTYRGTLSHYSVAPEPFYLNGAHEMAFSEGGELLESARVRIVWEQAIDPDPFDDVTYVLIIDRDEARMKRAVRQMERDVKGFLVSSLHDSLAVVEEVPSTEYDFIAKEGGVYYWAVAARDRAYHVRMAKKGRETVARFMVAVPDLWVREIRFSPTRWITTTPEQGDLFVTIANTGTARSDTFRLTVHDEVPGFLSTAVIADMRIPKIPVMKDTVIRVAWDTPFNGMHRIRAVVDPDSLVLEQQECNNETSRPFISVPKGLILTRDSVEVMATGYDSTEIPVVPEVYFPLNSSEVDSSYIVPRFNIPPILAVLADRLVQNRDIVLSIFGSIDALSGEKDERVAEDRAASVYQALKNLGVPARQLRVKTDHPQKVLGRRAMPADSMDAVWVMEQNRVVAFSVPQADEVRLFRPIPVAVDTTLRDSVYFGIRIVSPGRVNAWSIEGIAVPIAFSDVWPVPGDSLKGTVSWTGTNREKVLVPRNQWYSYRLTLRDTLDRTFSTLPDSIFLQEKRTIRRKEVFGAAKFAQVEPVYSFYWDRLLDIARELAENPSMHLRFEGNACAIGPEAVNMRLSKQRAERFTEAFISKLSKAYPSDYRAMLNRIEKPLGYGEREPLVIKLRNAGEVLLGDNDSPVGRFYNRRISVLLYREN